MKLLGCLVLFFLINTKLLSQSRCLLADYPLDDNAIDVYDAHNGTLFGTSPTTDRFGNQNKALYFNGSSDWVRLGTDADFRERSVSLWFKADTFISNGDFGLVFTTDNANLMYGGTGLAVDNLNGVNRLNSGVGVNVIRLDSMQSKLWYHFVITVDRKVIKVYLNNKLISSMFNNSFWHSDDGDIFARLGCSRKNDRFFKGSIDDVKIYNCALTSCEVSNLYYHVDSQAIQNSFKVYPSPTNHLLNIEVPCDAAGTFQIINEIGQIIIEAPIKPSENVINIESLSAGIYTIVMFNNKERSAIKFVKSN
jgi:hypothetical protein